MDTITCGKTERVFAVVRVSRAKDDAKSPAEQEERIRKDCKEQGMRVLEVGRELDVSGGANLAKRPALRRAIELVEAGNIDVVEVAYFDRLVRSLKVQEEIISRVEDAGGRIRTVDFGDVSHGTAVQWLSATMIGMFNDYYRRSVRERTEQYRANAVANGIAPFPNLPVPFYKGPDKRIAVNWDLVPIVQRAFEMRAETPAKSLTVIRKFLADHGIVLTNRGVNAMLQNRLMIGELRFGRYVNETAVPPVIEPALFRRVQEAIIPRGRRAVSEMLLARQAILYCASCGSKMVGGCVKNGRHKSEYRTYRCPNSDCPARATISAHNVELLVREEAARLWGERQGRASVDKPLAAVRERRDAAREALDAAVEAFTGIEVASARAKLLRLQQELDEASDEYDELVNATVPLETFSISANFDELTLEQWRDAIRLVIGRVEVKRGRLEIVDKVTVIPRS